jgi:hypothetical protein
VTVTAGQPWTFIDISMRDHDAYRVQQAVDVLARSIGRDGQLGGFSLSGRRATQAVRVSGFEPGTCLIVGFILGLLLDSVLVQLRDARLRLA